MRVLVVDDSRPMRMFLRRMLETGGHEVVEASNGGEALKVARDTAPHAALVDWNMPEVDGLTCLQMLKHRHGAEIKVVLTTAEADSTRMEEAMANGADGYVMKPFTAEEILAVLSRLGA